RPRHADPPGSVHADPPRPPILVTPGVSWRPPHRQRREFCGKPESHPYELPARGRRHRAPHTEVRSVFIVERAVHALEEAARFEGQGPRVTLPAPLAKCSADK